MLREASLRMTLLRFIRYLPETNMSMHLEEAAVSVGHLGGEGVEREVAQEVAAHAGVDLDEAAAGLLDPGEGDGGGEAFEFGAQVGVAQHLGGAALEQEEVFEDERVGAEQGLGLGL